MKQASFFALGLAAVVSVGACAAGSPPGFSDGTNWTVPVVGALDDGPLMAPIYINDQGPFLFALNPRSMSTIDPELMKNLDLYMQRTDEKMLSSNDKFSHEKLDMVEILKLEIGTLTINKTHFIALPAEARYHGQRVWGTIGREVFAESLIWTIDRDRQVVHIATQGHERAPSTATRLKAERVKRDKFFVKAKLNGKKSAYVFIDPCMYGSRIWPRVASAAHLPHDGRRWNAETVNVGSLQAEDVPFFEYKDQRVRKRDWDGMLGMEFFARYHVTINWHEGAVWLDERASDINEYLGDRITRWGASVEACATVGCTKGEVITDGEATTLRFERDEASVGKGLEAIFEAVDDRGHPLHRPRIIVAFPPEANSAAVRGQALNMYASAAGLRLVDITPFVPPCDAPGGQGCVYVEN